MTRLLTALSVSLAVAGCAAQREARVTPPDALLQEFDARVTAYAELRDKLDEGAARLTETAQPEEIVAAEKALSAKIQSARGDARRGEIFTPDIERRFRALLNPELDGRRGRNTRGIIMDENPGSVPFKVNAAYPKEEPLATIPTNILAALPPLPEAMEYRFVNRHLILRDARSNLIVDFIPNAIS
jgi:hypothetical protein